MCLKIYFSSDFLIIRGSIFIFTQFFIASLHFFCSYNILRLDIFLTVFWYTKRVLTYKHSRNKKKRHP
ncbi:hypothetical protein ES332_D04G103700v1 [Gossypium tomentosum]|uniref:Uncharacterized protein n=1 Tax=Gossypium tomentosum TaxID=34277 RepID=A0A5D2LBV7_GOSTO|nr:hypothetical protein ES332_D04G103700v1 [Gossypium tomentosum]